MKESLYSERSGLILGFHGCDASVVDLLLHSKDSVMNPSHNDYDWLGSGMYFWENNEERALEYAKEAMLRKNSTIKEPSVIGAVIDLGFCLDLTDTRCLKELKSAYVQLEKDVMVMGDELPKNVNVGSSKDLYLRRLDCAVINSLHASRQFAGLKPYDSVKGAFLEGDDLYPNSGFKEKNHIQICIKNPNCIKGFFLPRKRC